MYTDIIEEIHRAKDSTRLNELHSISQQNTINDATESYNLMMHFYQKYIGLYLNDPYRKPWQTYFIKVNNTDEIAIDIIGRSLKLHLNSEVYFATMDAELKFDQEISSNAKHLFDKYVIHCVGETCMLMAQNAPMITRFMIAN